jgi:hypothetical protein
MTKRGLTAAVGEGDLDVRHELATYEISLNRAHP